jgi:hypothetical protein
LGKLNIGFAAASGGISDNRIQEDAGGSFIRIGWVTNPYL